LFIFGVTDGYQESNGSQSFWRDLGSEIKPCLFQKPNKSKCTTSFVPIIERMIFDDKIEEMTSFGFYTRIRVLPKCTLKNISNNTFETF
jgi:hypothetical protein